MTIVVCHPVLPQSRNIRDFVGFRGKEREYKGLSALSRSDLAPAICHLIVHMQRVSRFDRKHAA